MERQAENSSSDGCDVDVNGGVLSAEKKLMLGKKCVCDYLLLKPQVTKTRKILHLDTRRDFGCISRTLLEDFRWWSGS